MHSSFLKRSWITLGSFFTFLKFSHLFKVSYIFGSAASFFSVGSIIAPLAGAYFRSSGAIVMFCLSIMLRILLVGFNPFLVCVHHLPGLCASLYWGTRHWALSILVPIMCMILFIIHPVGGHAWLYSVYWFIPIILFYLKPQSIYLNALSSTFIAHAVGSVFWLYGKPMAAQVWLSLIPLVCLERLLFAAGMTGIMYVTNSLADLTFDHLRLAVHSFRRSIRNFGR